MFMCYFNDQEFVFCVKIRFKFLTNDNRLLGFLDSGFYCFCFLGFWLCILSSGMETVGKQGIYIRGRKILTVILKVR